jgi:hypothetical protein
MGGPWWIYGKLAQASKSDAARLKFDFPLQDRQKAAVQYLLDRFDTLAEIEMGNARNLAG